MENELEHSRIEQRNRDLHKLGAESQAELLHTLKKETFEVGDSFRGVNITPPAVPLPPKKTGAIPFSMKLLRAFTLLAITSALLAIGYFGYQFLDPSGRPSEKNILLSLDMPVGANPGAPVEVTVHITNKNNVALDGADIFMQFPAGSYVKKDDAIVPLKEAKSSLGIIAAGETAEYRMKAYILGEEQQLKEVKATLSFRFINLNPTFSKSEVRSIRMLASPVTLTVETLKKATSGQEVVATILIRSNTEVPLKDVLISMEYPLGFVFTDATPRPLIGNNLWNISELAQSDSSTIVVNGVFTNEGAVDRVLRTRIGAADIATPHEISAQYQEVLTSIALEAPFVQTAMLFNDRTADKIVARYGVRISGSVSITNTSRTPISHAVVEVNLTGSGLDPSTIEVGKNGIYRAETNTITWDERNEGRLTRLDPGNFANMTFSFVPNAGRTNGQFISNPQITASVSVKAIRENQAGVSNEVRTLSSSVIKVATQAEFAARALHFSGAFKNEGEMPPRVDKETQFTAVWSVRNASNALEKAEVRGLLPPHTRWSGVVAPVKEDVRYDPITHEVVWKIGAVPAGAGVGSVPSKEVSFQIILIPTKNQVGTYPTLLEKQMLSAVDVFTTQAISIKQLDLNTSLPTDPDAADMIGRVGG